MRSTFIIFCLLILTVSNAAAQIHNLTFTRMDASDGLNDNLVQHIMQLPDGRMAITTRGNINIYDGAEFRYIHTSNEHVMPLREYRGAYHVYVDKHDLLWVKNWETLRCFSLRLNRYVSNIDSVYRARDVDAEVTDLFVDSNRHLWLVTPQQVINTATAASIKRNANDAVLQDIEVSDNLSYLFYSNGEVRCHDKSGTELYRSSAYTPDKAPLTDATSLVVKMSDGNFCQLRNGSEGVCLHFSASTREWKELLRTDYMLHTVITPSDSDIYITTSRSTIHANIRSGHITDIPHINIKDETPHTDGLNTIFTDSQGGVWLGTYDKGLLYAHPSRFRIKSYKGQPDQTADSTPHPLTDSRGWVWQKSLDGLMVTFGQSGTTRTLYTEDGLSSNSIHSVIEDPDGNIWAATGYGINRIRPDMTIQAFTAQDGTLTGAYTDDGATLFPDGHILFRGLDGHTILHPDSVDAGITSLNPILTGVTLNGQRIHVGHRLLPQAEPYVSDFTFRHNENNISFDISALNYALPEHTTMLYRIMSGATDTLWHTASTANGLIDAHGVMHLSFLETAPGNYTLQVKSAHNQQPLVIGFEITPPWWQTAWARMLILIAIIIAVAASFITYTRITRMRIRQRHKEEILLMRIRNLIEREQLRSATDSCTTDDTCTDEAAQQTTTETEHDGTPSDNEFISQAIGLVEKNLNTRGYSVEQLSKDLCMDRTGLYKKMTSMLDKSPSVFIRSIRLQHAERLLIQTDLSISQIAERTGFSSASHMSRCFQEEKGCTPKQIRESR